MKSVHIKLSGMVSACIKSLLPALIVMLFGVFSAYASDGNYKVSWGTNGTNGTGGSVTSTPSITNGTAVSYSGAHTITFNISPTAGYYVSDVSARRTKSDGTWNGWYSLNNSNVSMIVLNSTNTTMTLDTSQYNNSYRNYEIQVTFAAINVNVSWGANGSANDGNGGTVTSSGKTVTNTQNVSPSFNATDTASFTINPGSGNTVSNVQYLRDDWASWATVPGWSSGNTTFSFGINNHGWSVRVTFQIPQNITSSITAYYGTTNTADFNTNAADWVGGNIYRSTTQIGTASHLYYTYSTQTSRVIHITPSSGYKIVSVKWAEATWTDAANVTPATSFTDVPVVQAFGTSTNLTLPTIYDSQFTLTVSSPKSYVVWVVFAPVGATGGTVGAWYGTNNTTGYDTPQADGSGGTVSKTSGTTIQLANRNSSGVTLTADGTVTFQASPASGFKVTSVSYSDPNNGTFSSVTVPANQTTPLSFSFSVSGGNAYKIWVVFTSTAASSFLVSGTIDPATDASCTSNSISPASQVVNINQTGSFTFGTSTNCMIDSVNFNSGGAQAWVGSGSTYTTPAITATSSFTVKFRPVGFNIVSEIDSSSPSGCGTISPLGTNNYPRASNTTFTITTAANCSISHVWVTDTNVGLTTDTDIAPLSGSTYTFQDLQAAGHIKVQYTSIVPATSDAYCQIPAFVAGQASLAPNVLIIFDNSGSMADKTYYNIKTYNCTASSTLSNCTNFYGYFDPGKMYKIGATSNQYLIDNVTLNLSSTNGKSGNYLNYLNMEKTDIIRKALMGGKVVDRTASDIFLKTNNGKTVEYGASLPTGIVQDLSGKVRFGMMVFNDPPEGGHIATVPNTTRLATLGASQDDLVAAMESSETDPSTNTPIAETLYEAIRYYQAKPSAYNTGVDYGTMDPVQNACQKHFILLLTDGEPNSNNNLPGLSTQPTMNNYTDVNFNVSTWENRIPSDDRASNNNSTCFTNTYKCPPGSASSCATNSEKVEAVAYYMHATDLRPDKDGTQNITLFNVYAFGNGSGTKTLQMAAKYGGFNNTNGNLPDPNTWPSPDDQTEWNAKGDCVPDNYFEADDGQVLESNIQTAMSNILAKVASGTAASILSNSEGSGANLLQAVFYPNKIFPAPNSADSATEANWIGELQNLWYYVDPFIANSTVREDTDFSSPVPSGMTPTTPNHIMNLKNDYATRFYFLDGETKVELKQDTDGDGLGDTLITAALDPDAVKSLWRAGRQLWARTADSRTIHTSVDGYSLLEPTTGTPPKGGFYAPSSTSTRVNALQPYLQVANNDSNAEAMNVINYIRGTDVSTSYRNRTVSLLVSGATVSHEWKLGDIVSSTPRLQSTNKLNSYDALTPVGYNDKSYGAFISSSNYLNRGMVYVGANDGMLHAFKLGKLTVASGADTGIPSGSGTLKIGGYNKATLTGTNLGEEQWAYIPRNALPYLKYFTDTVNYKHIYYVDGPTVISDVSVGTTGSCSSDYSFCPKDTTNGTNWRTVLIGSMGLGGASRLSTNSCSTAASGGTCVKTPIFDPDDTAATKTKGVGYSSYFALDITNQYFDSTTGALAGQPVLKWEFPPRDAADNFGLGFATSGAAIVRIAAKLPADGAGVIKPDTSANGKWFAVFASGPTGPIDSSVHRFMGRSDQNLKLFVVDLGATVTKDSPFVLGTNYWVIDTGIANAFGGSVTSGAIDTDRWLSSLDGNYQDDALYVGYTKKRTDAEGSWTDGGVGRLLTKESTNPSDWVFSKVIDGIGPVTTAIAKLQDRKNKKLWLFFGSGRFYYTGDDSLTASNNQRYIMGVQDPCYTADNKIDPACSSSPLALSDLLDQTTTIAASLGSNTGWYVKLDAKDDTSSLGAERSITDPVALTNGAVFFTTFKPTTDVCKYGGYTYMWGVNYATGGAASAAALTGKALIQVSTGAFEEIQLKESLTAQGNRKMATPMIGKPPLDAPPIITNAANKPAKKILHIQEK